MKTLKSLLLLIVLPSLVSCGLSKEEKQKIHTAVFNQNYFWRDRNLKDNLSRISFITNYTVSKYKITLNMEQATKEATDRDNDSKRETKDQYEKLYTSIQLDSNLTYEKFFKWCKDNGKEPAKECEVLLKINN